MNLKEWLDKNCPDDGPRYYSFDYQKYKRDTLNDEKRYKEFAVKKFEKIVEDVIRKDFQILFETSHDSRYATMRMDYHNLSADDIEIFGNKKYVVDDIFLNKLIAKIKARL